MGGGIALVFKEHLSVSPLAAQEGLTSIEHNAFNLRLQHTTITIHVIYRYPNTSTLNFCNELVQIAERTMGVRRPFLQGISTFIWIKLTQWTQSLSMMY